MRNTEIKQKGFGLVEIIVAVGIWAILAGSGMVMILGSFRVNRLADESDIAAHYAAEGIDAVDALRKQGWTSPLLVTNCVSGCGLATVSGTWSWAGTSNTFGRFTRQILVTPVNRDGAGNIVSSGGTVDSDTYKVESRVSWSRGVPPITNTTSLLSYLTNYGKSTRKGGVLVYGDGGATTDAMKYKTIDGSGTWSAATAMADVDSGTTNRVPQMVEVFASATRNEKVAISRHYDGASQYIYGQVYNGTSWGNVQLLSSWAATTFLEVRNFDGAYLNDGTFMAVYSDNTNVPKMRTWNGTSWSTQTSLTSLGAAGEIPTYVRLANRPGSNEAMAVFFTQALDAISEYWSGTAWSAITTHATNGWNASNQEADFAWSPNTTTIGIILYITGGGDKTPRMKLFQANGTGGGTWGAQVNGTNIAQAIRTMTIAARNGANEFQSCYKDQQATPDITCRKITFSGTTATWATPTNPIITAGSVNSTNLSFGLSWEAGTGTQAVMTYSDNTNVPKIKKYNPATSTWDSAVTSVVTTPYTLGSPVQSAKIIPLSGSDDLMLLWGDNNLDLYSGVWDGTNNLMYTTPAGNAFLQHGVNGSATANFWYDFVWDN